MNYSGIIANQKVTLLMIFFLFFFSLSAKNIVIANTKENPHYIIVIPSHDPYNLVNYRLAAEKIKDFIYNITEIDLEIQYNDDKLPEYAILIGLTKFSKKICPRLKEIQPEQDAFHLVVSGNYLLINGGKRGIIYGVYELFERFANVRFYATWMFVVPKSYTFEVPTNLDLYSEADFFYRENSDNDLFDNSEWYSYNRFDSGENFVDDNIGRKWERITTLRTILELIDYDNYTVTKYPERYALKENGNRNPRQPCLSNKDNYRVVLENIKKEADEKNDNIAVDISQFVENDYCHCDECLKKFKQYGNMTSGICVDFVNNLIKEINTFYPNMSIIMKINSKSFLPPKNISVHPNIIIKLDEYGNDKAVPLEESNCSGSVEFVNTLKGWTKLTKKVVVCMHTGNDVRNELIHPNWFTIGKDLQTFKKYGVYGTDFHKVSPFIYDFDYGIIGRMFSDFEKLKVYVHSKMSWNVSLDQDSVINDFLRGYYGPRAAPYIRQYIDDAYSAIKACSNTPLFSDSYSNDEVYEPLRTNFLDHGYKLWQRAIKEASEESDKRMLYNTQTSSISHLMSMFRYQKDYSVQAEWTLDSIKNKPSEELYQIAKSIPQYCPSYYIPDKRSKRLCYLGGGYGDKNIDFENDDWFARQYFKFITNEVKPDILECGVSKFASKDNYFGGKGGILQFEGWNYIDYNSGGFDFNVMTSQELNCNIYTGYHPNEVQRSNFTKIDNHEYSGEVYDKFNNNLFTIKKRYVASGNGVKGLFSVKYANQPLTRSINAIVTVACNFGDNGDSVVWKRGNKWERFTLLEQQKAKMTGFKENAKAFIVVSPKTKKGMQFIVNTPNDPESVSIELNKTSKVYSVYIHFRNTYNTEISPEVSIYPISSVKIPTSVEEKENEDFEGLQFTTEHLSFIERVLNTKEGNEPTEEHPHVSYIGGDEQSITGLAFIAPYVDRDDPDFAFSPSFHRIEIPNHYPNYVHYGDTYNFSFRARCDVTDSKESSFAYFFTDAKRSKIFNDNKNVKKYRWFSFVVENITSHISFGLQTQKGASKCYVNEVRAVPIKLSDDYKPLQEFNFTFKEHSPMPPVFMYYVQNEEIVDDKSSFKVIFVSVIILCSVIAFITTIIVSLYIYYRNYYIEDKESVSEPYISSSGL